MRRNSRSKNRRSRGRARRVTAEAEIRGEKVRGLVRVEEQE